MARYLIVSDTDGTLLPYGQKDLDREVFDIIRQLLAQGHQFAVASGRDYTSLKRLFFPVWPDIYFISAHGNQIFYQDQLLYESHLSGQLAREIAEDAQQMGLEAVITSSEASVILTANRGMEDILTDYRTVVEYVDHFDQFDQDAIKVAVYCPQGVLAVYDKFQKKWGGKIKLAPSADNWLDFMQTDKGEALKFLADDLNIALADTWAFGDQYNDLPMLKQAGHPYLIKDSYPELQRFDFAETDDVLKVLKSILSR